MLCSNKQDKKDIPRNAGRVPSARNAVMEQQRTEKTITDEEHGDPLASPLATKEYFTASKEGMW